MKLNNYQNQLENDIRKKQEDLMQFRKHAKKKYLREGKGI